MNRLKKSFTFLHEKKNKKIVLGIFVLLIGLILGITFSANVTEEVKSVEIASNDWDAVNPTPGSWHIDKSAEWTDVRKAQIKFELNTVPKFESIIIENYDVVLTLDVSTSMKGEKIEKLKESANQYIDNILQNTNNRIAIVEYSTNGAVLSNFTNNSVTLKNIVNNLTLKCPSGSEGKCTNYYDGLAKTAQVLKDYQPKDNRQLVVLFLTDGYVNKDAELMRAEYEALKESFPRIFIAGIQYEMGSAINYWLKQISDVQLDAYVDNIYDKLFESMNEAQKEYLEVYEEFEITDYISEYFNVNSLEDIKVSRGKVELREENGLQKVIWNLKGETEEVFMTGDSATMTIDINLKDVATIEPNMLFPTNEKESIKYKLPDKNEVLTESDKTPILKNGYRVTYDVNYPESNCSSNASKLNKSEVYMALDMVEIKNETPSCSNYLFKGWEITDESLIGVEKVTDNTFIMPSKNLYIKGTWTKVAISKAMKTEEYVMKFNLPFNGETAYLDNIKSEFVNSKTGVNFSKVPSTTNGKGLYVRAGTENDEYPIFYYRGAVTNNNVLFANKCWKIVRTTETGGTKLIYNGIPDTTNTNGMCENIGSAALLSSTVDFNSNSTSPADVGYMVGTRYASISGTKTPDNGTNVLSSNYAPLYRSYSMNSTNYFYSKSPSWNGSRYTLGSDAQQFGTWSSNYSTFVNEGYYTCKQTSATATCTTLYYIVGGESSYAYALLLTSGKTLNEANVEMKLASDFTENGDGTYTLVNPVTVKRTEWYANYSTYKSYYICSDYTSTTCSNLYSLAATTNYNFTYMNKAGNFKYANDVTWNGSSYVLKNDNIMQFKTGTWSTNYNKLNNNHYTCFANGELCTSVYYIYYTDSSSLYYIELKNGTKIEGALEEMFPDNNDARNKNDSTIKDYIENTWFANEGAMTSYNSYLEDAVWCNDRTITSLGGWNSNGGSTSNSLYFGGFKRKSTPAVKNVDACPNKNDRFTVNDMINGNGKSKYKVGLLTKDEITMAGNEIASGTEEKKSYLDAGKAFMTLSPYRIEKAQAYGYGFFLNSTINSKYIGVRPAISLKSSIVAKSGDGTAANPYRVG